MTEEERIEFVKASRPLMEYLRENHHPHMTAVVDSEIAELLEGTATAHRKEWPTICENSPSQCSGEC